MAEKGAEIAAADRRVKAMELRAAGASFRQIGQQLGVTHTQARRDVLAGLKALNGELVEQAAELAALEWQRLELPLLPLVQLIRDGELGPAERCQAIETWRKLSESRRKLRGLDAPAKLAPTTPDGQPYKIYVGFSPDDV